MWFQNENDQNENNQNEKFSSFVGGVGSKSAPRKSKSKPKTKSKTKSKSKSKKSESKSKEIKNDNKEWFALIAQSEMKATQMKFLLKHNEHGYQLFSDSPEGKDQQGMFRLEKSRNHLVPALILIASLDQFRLLIPADNVEQLYYRDLWLRWMLLSVEQNLLGQTTIKNNSKNSFEHMKHNYGPNNSAVVMSYQERDFPSALFFPVVDHELLQQLRKFDFNAPEFFFSNDTLHLIAQNIIDDIVKKWIPLCSIEQQQIVRERLFFVQLPTF